jgi:hypothetical protein
MKLGGFVEIANSYNYLWTRPPNCFIHSLKKWVMMIVVVKQEKIN